MPSFQFGTRFWVLCVVLPLIASATKAGVWARGFSACTSSAVAPKLCYQIFAQDIAKARNFSIRGVHFITSEGREG